MGSRHCSTKKADGPLTTHSQECNEGNGVFLSITNAELLIFAGLKVANVKSVYLDEFGNTV